MVWDLSFWAIFSNNYDGNKYILFQDLHDPRGVIFQNFRLIFIGPIIIIIIIISIVSIMMIIIIIIISIISIILPLLLSSSLENLIWIQRKITQ